MQNSARRHVLADVRLKCGLTQRGLAEILGCHLMSVQKIEQGLLALSAKIARRAAKELDLSEAWLRANDPKQPPVTARGSLWSRRHYENAQDRKRIDLRADEQQALSIAYPLEIAGPLIDWQLTEFHTQIHALLSGTKGTPSQGVVMFRVRELLKNLAEEFASDPEILAAAKNPLQKLQDAYVKAAMELTNREFTGLNKIKLPGSLTVTRMEAPDIRKKES